MTKFERMINELKNKSEELNNDKDFGVNKTKYYIYDYSLEENKYTVSDVARKVHMTERTIRNYLKDGILKGTRVGGQWRFSDQDLIDLLNDEINALTYDVYTIEIDNEIIQVDLSKSTVNILISNYNIECLCKNQ